MSTTNQGGIWVVGDDAIDHNLGEFLKRYMPEWPEKPYNYDDLVRLVKTGDRKSPEVQRAKAIIGDLCRGKPHSRPGWRRSSPRKSLCRFHRDRRRPREP